MSYGVMAVNYLSTKVKAKDKVSLCCHKFLYIVSDWSIIIWLWAMLATGDDKEADSIPFTMVRLLLLKQSLPLEKARV